MAVGYIDDETPPLVGLKVTNGRREYAIDARDWRPMKIGDRVIPGYFWIPVADDENGAWSSYWMRVEAGAFSPEHQHDSTELVMVLNGVFTDDDGADFLPGQTVTYPVGSRHSTSSTVGCTVLVVAQTGSSIVSDAPDCGRPVSLAKEEPSRDTFAKTAQVPATDLYNDSVNAGSTSNRSPTTP